MDCDAAEPFIEAVAVGEPVPDGVAAHVASCAGCAARLALARRIEAALAARPVPVTPADFSTTVMTRLRRERWRTEQVVDFGFNMAVAIGALLIVAGIGGLAWRAGVTQIGGEMGVLLVGLVRSALTRAVLDAQSVVPVAVLLTTAAALWWWAEEDAFS